MDTHKEQNEFDFINYWQKHFWQYFFNQEKVSLDRISKFKKLHITEIENAAEFTDFAEESIWLCPYITKQGDNSHFYTSIFLPLCVKNLQLQLQKNVLPWVPGNCFKPSAKIYFPHVALYENFLTNEWREFISNHSVDTLDGAISQCEMLLTELFECDYKKALTQRGLNFENEWLVISDKSISNYNINKTPLVKRFGQIHSSSKEPVNSNNFYDFVHFLQARPQDTAQEINEQLEVVLSLLSLKKGSLQAVSAPLGSRVNSLINQIIVNQLTVYALGKKDLPNIAILSRASKSSLLQGLYKQLTVEPECFIQNIQAEFPDLTVNDVDSALETIHQKMMQAYEENLSAMSLMRTFIKAQKINNEQYENVENYLTKLADEDDQNDTNRNKYLEIHKKWQNIQNSHTLFQKCVGWLSVVKKHRKKRAGKFLEGALQNEPVECPYDQQLIEQIRALKVKQAKNDQKRIEAAAFLTQFQKARTNWIECLKKYGVEDDITKLDLQTFFTLLKGLHEQLWNLGQLYWQGINLKKSSISQHCYQNTDNPKWNIHCLTSNTEQTKNLEQTQFEYLFIEDSHLLIPQDILNLISHADRAIFFGDNLSAFDERLVSNSHDDRELENFDFEEGEKEQIQETGGLLNSPNAFKMAQNNSLYQSPSPCGLYKISNIKLRLIGEKNPELFEYWNDVYHHGGLELLRAANVSKPAVHLVSVKNGRGMDYNVGEIEMITDFIRHTVSQEEKVCIVTPFYKQKGLFGNLLKDFQVSVHTFDDLPESMVDIVIFSPVYCSASQRPFVIDEGQACFYNLFSLAKKAIWVFGDPDIFDEKRHSPTGKFAKFLRNMQKEKSNEFKENIPETEVV